VNVEAMSINSQWK